ncbi:pentapeptide repeat-containing protein [Demequina capsici]|uniref:Pentapeptide repeat-containing protein n=1 Tax=Demequina capsici TaxID=3075620 RepID=A0AA96FAN5_9MICO|nr:pentapeptide repeat-containing protein [Demequina sp. PMTSA13]WNM27246.1 pentapeptide repeat-containing protein [Demequina sp. PMTSA13]
MASSPTHRRAAQPEKGLQPPRQPALALDDLAEGFPGDLTPHDRCDGLRFADVDLAGRDLTGTTIAECELTGCDLHETRLDLSRILETRIVRANAPVLKAARSTWHEARIESSRLGAVELYEAELDTFAITRSKLSFVNLRGATLKDVTLTDCVIDELDLSQATAERIAFRDCRIDTLLLHGARLQHVDLTGADLHTIGGLDSARGIVVSSEQLLDLAPVMAAHLGIIVSD